MKLSTFPDLLKFGSLQDRGATLRRELSEAQLELTTGFRNTKNTIKHLNGRIGDAHLLRREIERFDRKSASFALGLGRASIVQNSLDQVLDTVGAIPETARAASFRNDKTRLDAAALEARSSVDVVFASLNAQYGRRFLFSGDETNVAPMVDAQSLVDDIEAIVAGATTAADVETALDTYFGAGGTFETVHYRGGDGTAATIELTENERVGVEVKADAQAFRDLIRGLAVTATAGAATFEDAERNTMLQNAATDMIDGIEGVSVLIAETGLTENRIANAQARLQAEEAIVTEAYVAMAGQDPYIAATRAQELEVQLQTTYTMTARLAQLNFTNFIS
ncbi:MAG: flagellin [Pseudomonadota bacterium]